MIPDLGKYAATILGAYGVTLVLLGGLVLASWRRSARARAELARLEAARGETRGRPTDA
ncbi:MAG: heme exporter protein CcmD [Amaricoccus sp.]|uniref:heme exporter protein CcmD n=1 Tax=Amaricoccus sp. TaxID=1872485 RepID=UPI0039E3DF71